jgi:hypothetical protein
MWRKYVPLVLLIGELANAWSTEEGKSRSIAMRIMVMG